MAKFNDNNIGAISGAVRDMVSEQTNRAMNGHGIPEAPKYAETDCARTHTSSPAKFILAAVLFLAAVVLVFTLILR